MINSRNAGYFLLSPNLLAEALNMPEANKIEGVEWDYISRSIRVFVTGPDLPKVEQGETLQMVVPEVTESVQKVHTWQWGRPK